MNNQEIGKELKAKLDALLNNPDHLSGEQLRDKIIETLEENGVDLHAPLPPAEIVAQWKDSP